ncbi:MAG: hypothetical protein QW728_08030, partial [Thermoplasmata archaeon]
MDRENDPHHEQDIAKLILQADDTTLLECLLQSGLKDKMEEFEKRLAEEATAKIEYEKKLREKEAEIERQERELNRRKLEMEELERKIMMKEEELEANLSKYKSILSEKDRQVNALTGDIETMKLREKAMAETKVELTEKEKELSKRLEEVTSELSRIQEEMGDINKREAGLDIREEAIIEREKELIAKKSALEVDIERNQRKMEILERKEKELEVLKKDVEGKLVKVQEEALSLKSREMELEKARQNLEREFLEVNQLKLRLSVEEEELANKKKQYEELLEEYQKKLKELEQKEEMLEKQKRAFEEQIKQKEAQLEFLRAELEKRLEKSRIDEELLKKKEMELHAKEEMLARELETKKKELEDIRKEIENQERLREQDLKILSQKEQELAALKVKFELEQQMRMDDEKIIRQKEQELQLIQEKLRTEQAKRAEEMEKLRLKEQELQAIRVKLEEESRKRIMEEEKLQAKERELELIRQALESSQRLREAEERKLKAKEEDLVNLRAELQRQIKEREEKEKALKAKEEELKKLQIQKPVSPLVQPVLQQQPSAVPESQPLAQQAAAGMKVKKVRVTDDAEQPVQTPSQIREPVQEQGKVKKVEQLGSMALQLKQLEEDLKKKIAMLEKEESLKQGQQRQLIEREQNISRIENIIHSYDAEVKRLKNPEIEETQKQYPSSQYPSWYPAQTGLGVVEGTSGGGLTAKARATALGTRMDFTNLIAREEDSAQVAKRTKLKGVNLPADIFSFFERKVGHSMLVAGKGSAGQLQLCLRIADDLYLPGSVFVFSFLPLPKEYARTYTWLENQNLSNPSNIVFLENMRLRAASNSARLLADRTRIKKLIAEGHGISEIASMFDIAEARFPSRTCFIIIGYDRYCEKYRVQLTELADIIQKDLVEKAGADVIALSGEKDLESLSLIFDAFLYLKQFNKEGEFIGQMEIRKLLGVEIT